MSKSAKQKPNPVLDVLDLFGDSVKNEDIKAHVKRVQAEFPGDLLAGLRLLASVGVNGRIGAAKK